jgi:ElaB/YqjD/DUF883 family membrane-anchored ribosome-binding protein
MKTTMQLDKVVDDIKALGTDASDLVKAGAGDARERVCEARVRLERAIESARHTCEQVQQKAKKGFKATDECVRRHPYRTAGVAFGAGLFLGALAIWNRR